MPRGGNRRSIDVQIADLDAKIAAKEKSLAEYTKKKKAEITELASKRDELEKQRQMESVNKLVEAAKQKGITLDDLIKEMTAKVSE